MSDRSRAADLLRKAWAKIDVPDHWLGERLTDGSGCYCAAGALLSAAGVDDRTLDLLSDDGASEAGEWAALVSDPFALPGRSVLLDAINALDSAAVDLGGRESPHSLDWPAFVLFNDDQWNAGSHSRVGEMFARAIEMAEGQQQQGDGL